MSTKYCRNCANPLPPQAAFCNRCGAPVAETADKAEGMLLVPTQFAPTSQSNQPVPVSNGPETGAAQAQTPAPPPPPTVFSSQDLAIIDDDRFIPPAYISSQGQQREAIAALPTTHLANAEDEDRKDNIWPIAAAATGLNVEHLRPEEARGPHHQPADPRGDHQKPQDPRGDHRKPQDQRGDHHKPGDRRGNHRKPGETGGAPGKSPVKKGAYKAPSKLSGVLMGGAAAVLLIGIMITLITQASNGKKADASTPTPDVSGQSSALSVLQAGNAFPGGTITLHGEHFLPGGTVTFSAQDAGLASTSSQSTVAFAHRPAQPRMTAFSNSSPEQKQVASVDTAIPSTTVKDDGSFDTQFTIPADWQPGHHYAIQASEQHSGRSATAMVTLPVKQRPTPGSTPTTKPASTPTATPTTNQPANPTPVPTSAPIPVQRQLSANGSATASAKATGQGKIPGTHATGQLLFYSQNYTATLNNGDTFVNTLNPKVTMVLDLTASVTVPIYSRVIVNAHVAEIGTIGNIPAYTPAASAPSGFFAYYNGYPCSGEFPSCIQISSYTAFTGGTDDQTYTAVAQSDISTATTQAQNTATNTATQDLQNQLRANEHFVGDPQCSTTANTADHKAGDRATLVTVTVAVSCTVTAST